MKKISYTVRYDTGVDSQVLLARMELAYSQENLAIAGKEAYNGEYTVVDDGLPEPVQDPSQLDRVEAQAVYTAMMTDTLLEV